MLQQASGSMGVPLLILCTQDPNHLLEQRYEKYSLVIAFVALCSCNRLNVDCFCYKIFVNNVGFSSPSFHLQIFVGKIPRDLFEDELVPLFEKAGPIWDLRLMMDPLSGLNRGYAFVTFCSKEAAQEAVKLVRTPVITGKKFVKGSNGKTQIRIIVTITPLGVYVVFSNLLSFLKNKNCYIKCLL